MKKFIVHFKNSDTPLAIDADGYESVKRGDIFGFEFHNFVSQTKVFVGFVALSELRSVVIADE